MNEIKDLYNKFYIYINIKLDENIAKKEKVIDDKIKDFFLNRGVINPPKVTDSTHRSIKANAIRLYKKEQRLENQEDEILEKVVYNSALKIEPKLMLSKISSDPIKFEAIKNYSEIKEKYLEEIKISNPEYYKKLEKYFGNEEVQKLAATIDHDFNIHQFLVDKNLSNEMTFKDFANLIIKKYTPAVASIFDNLGKSRGDVGTDDRAALYTVVILLQKNDDFTKGIIALNNYVVDKINPLTRSFLNPLMSQLLPILSAISDIIQE
ncbi:MAG TPA: hypothetical protein PLC42_04960 [Parachlamydiaceae bacterium]|nr:hypothetical protein [Parachlamydiaceae bacterium]